MRLSSTSFEFTNGFDPTGEYLNIGFAYYSCCLIRTLMGYTHKEGPEGNKLIPDLAAEEPEVSEDGRTYTFRLRDGVRFAPPMNREVTSRDVAYAFERIGTTALGAQYGHYYDVVDGMAAFKEGKAKTIAGIETPDAKTIRFRLSEPIGDFLYRIAMPAAGPIPREVAKCFEKAGDYGRYVISSGPYMLEGSDRLDISSCDAMKPISGWSPTRHLNLVRNPNYDRDSDPEGGREAYVERITYTLNTNVKDIYDRISRGELDAAFEAAPPEVLRRYAQDEQLKERMHVNATDATQYFVMNLTQPPFDDIHVRKAVNWIVDKAGLRRAAGGPIFGKIAPHIVPDTMFNGELEDYRPYATPDDAGDLEKAKAEMRQSKYDTDKDGLCDASACENVFHLTATFAPFPSLIPTIEQSLRKIGIGLSTREIQGFFETGADVSKNIPFSTAWGWFKDYADASTFMVLFDGRNIAPQGNFNNALVGVTPEQAKELKIEGTVEGIPSVDADIDRCVKLTGDERMTCWQELDKKLMERVVPWVPWIYPNQVDIVSDRVTRYEFDQYAGLLSLSRVAVATDEKH